jgi:hypothetical protein
MHAAAGRIGRLGAGERILEGPALPGRHPQPRRR